MDMDLLRNKICVLASLTMAISRVANCPDAARQIERLQCLANLAEHEAEDALRQADLELAHEDSPATRAA